MKVVNTIVIGNGPASHYIGFCERRTELLVFDASCETHSFTAFRKRARLLSGGTMGLWGGNLFFDSHLLELGSTLRIQNFLSYICKDLEVKRYENEFGFGVLLPKGYLFKEYHPTIYESVKKFRKIGEYFEVHTQNMAILCTNLYLVTGSSAIINYDEKGWIYLNPAINQIKYDKIMRLDFSDQNYGSISMCSDINGQFISRYRLNNYGYEGINENYLLKLIHFFNKQIKLNRIISLEGFKLFPPILNRSLKKQKKRWMYLTTISDYSKGRNMLKIDASNEAGLYCRALHTEIFQASNVVSLLNKIGVVHDQKSNEEYGWRFGSVGNQIALLNSRMDL